jgi:Zn-dependent peptidase ImmA (M78 family)
MGDDLGIILLLGFTAVCAVGFIYECIKDYRQRKRTQRKTSLTRAKRKVQYSTLIREVVRWSGPLLLDHGIKKYPHVKISYRRCKGADGYYSPKHKTVEVLVNKSIDVPGLVSVTLHEIAHYIQDKTNPDFRNYDVYEHRVGYDNNPFEIEANKFANKYKSLCLKHLLEKGYVKS